MKHAETISDYNFQLPFEVDKSKSISELSRDELRKLINRLEMEQRAESLILDLKRNSGEQWDYENRPPIDTITPVDRLYHHGVPGMKWGVRKKRSGFIAPRATLSRRDRKEQEFLDDPSKVYDRVYQKAAPAIRKGTRLLNNDPKYKGQDFKTPSPLRSEYYKKYSDMVTQQLNAAATSKAHPFTLKTLGMSPKRTLQMKFSFDYEKELRASYDIAKADTRKGIKEEKKEAKAAVKGGSAIEQLIKHAEEAQSELILTTLADSSGFIIGIEDDEELFQAENFVQNFLAHHGVLGMKWGVRKDRDRVVSAPKTKGEKIPSSEEHKESRMFKTRATSGLSTAELRKLNERLQLEKTYKELTKTEKKRGKKLAEDILYKAADATLTTVASAASLYAIKKIIGKSMGESVVAEMFPKKSK